MVSLIKDNEKANMVPSCSIQIPVSDRARLNKIKGDQDLRTFSDTVKFLLKYYDEGVKKDKAVDEPVEAIEPVKEEVADELKID
jgi:hypothetical protein